MTGLTSVTFRDKTSEQIISIVKRCGLDGIEWGGDIHAPAGEITKAKKIKALTDAAGLRVLSYGSYYRLGESKDTHNEFTKILNVAEALVAPVIRVWAGNKSSNATNEACFSNIVTDAQIICKMAAQKNISIATEYHRNTLTDTAESTLSLIEKVNRENFSTYWQTNPLLCKEEHLKEISLLNRHISMVHVFNWQNDDTRCPLSDAKEAWREYFNALNTCEKSYIMEFVKDNSQDQLYLDSAALVELASKTKE